MEATKTSLSRWAAGQAGEPLLLFETAAELSLNLELRLREVLHCALRLARRRGQRRPSLRRCDVVDALETVDRKSGCDWVRRSAASCILAPQRRGGRVVNLALEAQKASRTLLSQPILRRANEAFELQRFHSMECELVGTPKKSSLTEEQKVVVLKLVSILEGSDKVRPSWLHQQMKQLDPQSLEEVAEFLAQHVPKRVGDGATDAELLYLLDALEVVATTELNSTCGLLLHLCLAPILVLCLGHRGQPGPGDGSSGSMSWSCDPGSSVSRRAADLLARIVVLHHSSWPQLGVEVLTLLQKALQRRPRWRALQGGALCLRHFGPRAVKELLLVTAQRPPQRSWCAALRAHSDGDAAPAVLAVLEALRLLAADHLNTVMEHGEQLAQEFGVDPEFLLLAFGNLADAHGSNFAPRGHKRKYPDEGPTLTAMVQEVASFAQASKELVLAQVPGNKAKAISKEPPSDLVEQVTQALAQMWDKKTKAIFKALAKTPGNQAKISKVLAQVPGNEAKAISKEPPSDLVEQVTQALWRHWRRRTFVRPEPLGAPRRPMEDLRSSL